MIRFVKACMRCSRRWIFLRPWRLLKAFPTLVSFGFGRQFMECLWEEIRRSSHLCAINRAVSLSLSMCGVQDIWRLLQLHPSLSNPEAVRLFHANVRMLFACD